MEMVKELTEYDYVFTFEDSELTSGFGAQVMNSFTELASYPKYFKKFGFPDEFVQQGSREQVFDKYGLTPEKMLESIERILAGGENE
jgi:1-deoxy-D-xylulose-5-phosphate synthase